MGARDNGTEAVGETMAGGDVLGTREILWVERTVVVLIMHISRHAQNLRYKLLASLGKEGQAIN